MLEASTSVTIPSRKMDDPSPSSSQNKGAMFPGSARPVVSKKM